MLQRAMAEELRIASERHLEKLVYYMERYPALAITSVRSREGLIRSQYMWEKIALNLNKLDTRVKKTAKAWFKYWLEWKIKIRQKYIQYQRSRGEGNSHHIAFTSCEERLLKIMTDREGNLLSPTLFMKKEGPLNGNNNNSPVREEIRTVTVNNSDVHMREQEDSAHSLQMKSIEELRRELVELELMKQKELFEMEKNQKREKHNMEMAILELRRQLLVKELDKT